MEYACRALAQLARCHDGRTLTRLEDLAQREAVSANFLVQILNDLRRAGLIDSKRGSSGGYLLSRPADSITLRQVVEAVDPSLLQVSVAALGECGPGVKSAWERVSARLHQALEDVTLNQLAAEQSEPMFYI